jgi:hypothetical protein
LTQPNISEIRKLYAGPRTGGSGGAIYRAETARELERDFALPPGSIAIYCAEIKPKIAEVSITIDNVVMKFNEYEKESKNRLSGGHLEAQIHRFERLWRIYFFIDASAQMSLSNELLLLIQQAVEDVVLGEGTAEQLTARSKRAALDYVHQQRRLGNNNIDFMEEFAAAARGDSTVIAARRYPNGAPTMRTFIRQN